MSDLERKMLLGEDLVAIDPRPRRRISRERQQKYLAHVNGTCVGCPECDEELKWEELWNGPTAASVKATTRAVSVICRQSYVAEYRALRGIHKSWSDVTVGALMEIEAIGAPKR